MRSVLAIITVALLFVGTAFQFRVRTPQGQQCPTATVQVITVAVKNCCGKVIGYAQRAPKPGEATFVQCRCAEKRAADHHATTSPKMEMWLASGPTPAAPPSLSAGPTIPPYAAANPDRTTPPSLRPPAIS